MNLVLYFIREMCGNLYRAKLLTTVSVITTGILLFFLLALSLLMLNIRLWLTESENQPQVSVYFSADLSLIEEEELADTINSVTASASSNLITREKSYEIFKELYGEDMLDAIDENPFPAVLEIAFEKGTTSRTINEITEKIGEFSGVESVVYSQEWLKELNHFRNTVSRGLILFAAVMIAVVFFTITNTIKLSVYAREDMIRNMQYIGASGWYIRAPFVMEGTMQGFLGAILAIIVIFLVKTFVGSFGFYWGDTKFFIIIILFGSFLGFLGSFFAVKRFVKL